MNGCSIARGAVRHDVVAAIVPAHQRKIGLARMSAAFLAARNVKGCSIPEEILAGFRDLQRVGGGGCERASAVRFARAGDQRQARILGVGNEAGKARLGEHRRISPLPKRWLQAAARDSCSALQRPKGRARRTACPLCRGRTPAREAAGRRGGAAAGARAARAVSPRTRSGSRSRRRRASVRFMRRMSAKPERMIRTASGARARDASPIQCRPPGEGTPNAAASSPVATK